MRRVIEVGLLISVSLFALAGDRVGTIVKQGDLLGNPSVESNAWVLSNRWGAIAGGGANVVRRNIFWFMVDSEGTRWLLAQELDHLPQPIPNGSTVKFSKPRAALRGAVIFEPEVVGKHRKLVLKVFGCHPVGADDDHWYDCP